ncbi:MAG TPA: FtsX-like permease family protein [Verrucomicrobiae bacterium]|nr:FtsX-like permease family protein [Verrucomicrobiae bacterium]
MSIGTFILKNALRNKRRATLSILSVAVSLFLLVTLLVALRELTVPAEGEGAALRVVVRSKISIANPLPARQRPIIERIPGVEAVSPFTWFGGKFKNEEAMTFAQFAMDPKEVGTIFVEAKVPPDEYAKFLADRQACIVGKITADKNHIKVGDRIVLTSEYYACTLEMHVVGIYQGTVDDRNLFFHQKYLDESIGDPGTVGTWWVKVKTAEDMPKVISAINHAFANTSAEVRAESERTFQLSFISMWGNIKLFVNSICTVVVFTLLLVSASTMSMAIRERFRELAILKALGFRRRELFAFILAESFGLAALGAIVGIGGAYCLYTYGNIAKMTQGIFIMFEVTPKIIGMGALVAAGLGIIASIAPSIAVARMSVVNGLKTLD